MVRALAKAAGRERDVVVLGPNGDHHFDLFGGRVVGLAEVDYVVQRLLDGTQDMGPQNAFWNEARYSMLHAAITLLTIVHDQFSFETATEFLRAWFFSLRTNPKVVTQAVERARRFLQRADAPPAMLRQVQSALDQVELYQVLEARTRSNLQSCLINALRPWTGVTAAQCFEATGRPAFDPGRVASEGKICIVSANALASQLAQSLFRLVWQDFFAAIQQRRGIGHRLTGVIAEELPLLVRPGQDQVEQISTVRAKRCFVMSSAQGLAALDDTLGARYRRAMLLNFNTVVFLRSREEETSELAFVNLGSREELWKRRRPKDLDAGTLVLEGQSSEPEYKRVLTPVCPPGTLGCLEPHQGFMLLANGQRTERPLWFMPWFEDTSFPKLEPVPPQAQPQQLETTDRSSAEYVHRLMAQMGRNALWSPEVVFAAVELCQPVAMRKHIVSSAECFFRTKACLVPKGLRRLPSCWLMAIPNILWKRRRPHWTHLPHMISALKECDGVLMVSFAQEENRPDLTQITRWDEIRLVLNLSLYPSPWRPLHRRHFIELWMKRQDLRLALSAGQPEVF
jgi:hypothetical protein